MHPAMMWNKIRENVFNGNRKETIMHISRIFMAATACFVIVLSGSGAEPQEGGTASES